MNAPKLLATLLTMVVICLSVSLWKFRTDYQRELATFRDQHEAAIAVADAHMRQAVTAQEVQNKIALQAVKIDYEKKISELHEAQRKQLAASYREFENILAGNKKTLDYINLLEAKIKDGQNISQGELERLVAIATGLSYLKKQYEKPWQEFGELQAYFEKQAAQQPMKPKANFVFFKRVLSRGYREAEYEFYRAEGGLRASLQAQTRFAQVYATAQAQMAALHLDSDKQVQKLYAFIEQNQKANSQDLGSFFEQARQALQTHHEVLKFQPDNLLAPSTVSLK